MAYTDTKINNMIFNILDTTQYELLRTGGQLDSNQLYFITDDGQQPLSIQLNGGLNSTPPNQNLFNYDGSSTVSINITPDSISAVNKTGDTMTGALTLNGDPTSALHAATKQYVDNAFSVNDAMQYKGVIHGSSPIPGTFTPAANAGDTYRVDVEGYINGYPVEIGDLLICNADNTNAAANNTYSTIREKWNIIQVNVDKALYYGNNSLSGDNVVLVTDGASGKMKMPGQIGTTTRPIYLSGAGIPTPLSYQPNRLYYGYLVNSSTNDTDFRATGHYASDTKIGINSTSTPEGVLHINGITTATDKITVTKNSTGKPEIIVNNGTYQASLMIDANGSSHGLYSRKTTNSQWIIYRDSLDNVYIPEWSTGSQTQPIYIDSNGHPQTTGFALNATINSGATNHIAYYSGNNEIDDAAHYVSASQVKIGADTAPDTGVTFQVDGKTLLNGIVEFKSGQRYSSDNNYAANLKDSDIIGLNGLYFTDISEGPTEGISFPNGVSNKWDTLYAYNNLLRFSPGRLKNSNSAGYIVPHTGETLGNVGSDTLGVYINDGQITPLTYGLNANVAPGTQWGVAYYSTRNNITSTVAGAAHEALMGNGSNTPIWTSVSPSQSWSNGTTNGPTLSITVLGVTSDPAAIPAANDTTCSGIITTSTQIIGGNKTFHGDTTHNGNVYFANGTTYYVDNYGNAKLFIVGVGTAEPDARYAINIGGDAYIYGTHYFGNGTTYYIDGTAQGFLRRLDVGSTNSNYILYSGGNTGINGNLDFTNNASYYDISWIYGSSRQRIHITKDSTNDTNVFQFQQTIDSGTTWEDLFTIKDNGELVLTKNTGGIYKLYDSDTNSQFIQLNSTGHDFSILRIDGNPTTVGFTNGSSYGFDLQYIGSETGEDNNKLTLFADNLGSLDGQVIAYDISNTGKIGIGNTYNPNFKLFVDGITRINDQLRITPIAASSNNESSGLIISSVENGTNGDVAFELWRGDSQSWQIINSNGTLIFRNNYTDTKQTTYSEQSITLDYNSGTLNTKVILPQADSAITEYTIGSTSLGFSSIYTGNLTIGGVRDETSGKSILSNSTLYLGSIANASVIFKTNNIIRARFNPDGHFYPETSNYDLGVESNQWRTLYTTGANIYKVQILPSYTGPITEGWYRMCKVYSNYNYGVFQILLTGGWNNGAPAVANISVNLRNGLAQMKILHCGFVGDAGNQSGIRKLRLVKTTDSTNNYWLDAYLSYPTTAVTVAAHNATFIGNVRVSNINDTLTSTSDTTATDEITLSAASVNVRDGLANRLAYYETNRDIKETGHYASPTKVAINSTTEPSYNLYVDGTVGISGTGSSLSIINDTSNNSNDALVYVKNYTSNDWGIKLDKGTTNYGLYIQGTGTNLLRVGTNDRFNVGESSVAVKTTFTVNGATTITGATTVNGTTTIAGATTITGNTKINGNLTMNGILYFANGTTYYVNNSALAYLSDLRVAQTRLVSNWLGFYTSANAGGNRLGYIVGDTTGLRFRIENGQSIFDFNGTVRPTSAAAGNLGATTIEWSTIYGRNHTLYRNGAWYGDFYINTVGTANTPATTAGGTDGVAGTAGVTLLRIGNNVARSTETAYGAAVSGANNSYGILRIYNIDTTYGDIYANQWSSYTNLVAYGSARGGYRGLLSWPSKTALALMSNGTDQGLYSQDKRWVVYHNVSNNRVGIGNSTVSGGLDIQLNGNTYLAGRLDIRPGSAAPPLNIQTAAGTWSYIRLHNGSNYWDIATLSAANGTAPAGALGFRQNGAAPSATAGVYITTAGVLMGAAWNDYAEYRKSAIKEPGRVVKESPTGEMIITTNRLERGCEIISDTYGFTVGDANKGNVPTAATGRVLAYTDKPRETFELGMPVCSGPNGTVSQMTEEEARMYPWCIIGTVSEIPTYEVWHGGKDIQVNNRIWIRIR